jgi:hypothetical protein
MNMESSRTYCFTKEDFTLAFPRSLDYPGYRALPGNEVREGKPGPRRFPYSERHLQCVWYDKRWRPPLQSEDGEIITVVDAGRWNLEAGPDFLDAVILVGAEERRIRGDVEVHVAARQWEQHGHGGDPAYRGVVLHVTYFEGSARPSSLPAGALQAPFREALTFDPSFSFENIDVAAYPYGAIPEQSPPCAEILMKRPPEDLQDFLATAGEERLRLKTIRLVDLIERKGADQALYEEVMAALGYKHNRIPFRTLADAVPLHELKQESHGDPLRAYAMLLGVSGLMPKVTQPSWDAETRGFVRELWDVWWKRRSAWEHRVMNPGAWRNSNIRPHNAPSRRIAAAACIFSGKRDLVSCIRESATDSPDQWFKRTQVILSCNLGIPFWNHHLGLASKHHDTPVVLLGAARAAAITTNVFIPFSAAMGLDIEPLLSILPPEQDNSLIRETASVLFGRDHNPAIYRHGLLQQGLLQVFHDFCLSRRTDCEACPLPGSLVESWGQDRENT